MNTVTRVEIADDLEGLFDGTAIGYLDLLYATTNDAREEVLITLSRLRGDRYQALPELWRGLNDIPFDL
jgi:hypothetical protein